MDFELLVDGRYVSPSPRLACGVLDQCPLRFSVHLQRHVQFFLPCGGLSSILRIAARPKVEVIRVFHNTVIVNKCNVFQTPGIKDIDRLTLLIVTDCR